MLTHNQRDTFRLTLASWRCFTINDPGKLNIDAVITDDQIVESQQPIEDFFKTNGRKLDRHGNPPPVPYELTKTLQGDLYVWKNHKEDSEIGIQTLLVMDFGTARACYRMAGK